MRRDLEKAQSAVGVTPYTPEEALAYIFNAGMTKDVYIETRLGAKKRNANIYPSYEEVKKVKAHCTPEGVTVSNRGEQKYSKKL